MSKEVLDNIVKYNPQMLQLLQDPNARALLEQEINSTYQKYKNVLKFAEVIDKIDKKTAIIKTALNVFGLPGKIIASAIDLPELLIKGIYSAYYTVKTGDLSAAPGWILYEGASSILPFGQVLDIRDTYKNKVKKNLEKIVAEKTLDRFLAKIYNSKKDQSKYGLLYNAD